MIICLEGSAHTNPVVFTQHTNGWKFVANSQNFFCDHFFQSLCNLQVKMIIAIKI